MGPFEVIALLGAGGMGEVYSARDLRLRRNVALKVLPAAYAADPDRVARFRREAFAASALQHPNIVTVLEIGAIDSGLYIAMELVGGSSLRKVIERGPVPIKKLLDLAAQIAGGLAKAHASGILHRDLKPENILVTSDGYVKLVDFGLAKFGEPVGDASGSATDWDRETLSGAVLGTMGYMSPEQASGGKLDLRTDQFALGAVLYEMATGERAFAGRTVADKLAAVLREEPLPLAKRRPTLPAPLCWAIERCLAKSADDRYASTEDLAKDLRDLRDHLSETTSTEPSDMPSGRIVKSWRELLAWGLAGTLLVVLLVLVAMFRSRAASPYRLTASLIPPQGAYAPHNGLALSPDGRRVVASSGGRLWLQELTTGAVRPLPGTDEDSVFPFWSPDGRSIGFFSASEGKLKTMEVATAMVRALCDAPEPRGGVWGPDGVILFAPRWAGPLMRISAAGGEPMPATQLDLANHERSHRWPQFLPDGRHFLYLAIAETDTPTGSVSLYVGSLASGQRTLVGRFDSRAVYVPSGHILTVRSDGTLVAQAFDAKALRTVGAAVPLAEKVYLYTLRQYGTFSVSQDGSVLVYESAPPQTRLTWYDRSGREVAGLSQPAEILACAISPNGERIAIAAIEPRSGSSEILIYDTSLRTSTRLTGEPGGSHSPVWSPDGQELAFRGYRKGMNPELLVKRADGTATERLLLHATSLVEPLDWSPDGRYLLYSSNDQNARSHLWLLRVSGGIPARPVMQSSSSEFTGSFSPDGRWLAYCSNESGQREVYVLPFPGAGEKLRISTDGGCYPRWARTKGELFYVAADRRLMMTRPAPEGSRPRFPSPTPLFLAPADAYDVAADGQRFLFPVHVDAARSAITVVLNWDAALRR